MLHRLSSQTLAEKIGVSGHNTNHPHAIRDNGGRHNKNNSYTMKLTLYKTWTFFPMLDGRFVRGPFSVDVIS